MNDEVKFAKKGGVARNSSIELFRIIIMLVIIAHHYIVNSGIYDVIKAGDVLSAASIFSLIFLKMRILSSIPGPLYFIAEVRFALSHEALKQYLIPKVFVISFILAARYMAFSSDSSAHGPAIRKKFFWFIKGFITAAFLLYFSAYIII